MKDAPTSSSREEFAFGTAQISNAADMKGASNMPGKEDFALVMEQRNQHAIMKDAPIKS